jgi:hypothetical protein
MTFGSLENRSPAMPDHPHLGARKIVRFGNFEEDLRNEELRRAGIRIRVQAQPFRMLALLLERPRLSCVVLTATSSAWSTSAVPSEDGTGLGDTGNWVKRRPAESLTDFS